MCFLFGMRPQPSNEALAHPTMSLGALEVSRGLRGEPVSINGVHVLCPNAVVAVA